jgi:hypothetical protein
MGQEAPTAEIQDNTMDDTESISAEDADWENRRLCSDGNCIGVVGPDGRCKECGLRHDPPATSDPDRAAAEDDAAAETDRQAPVVAERETPPLSTEPEPDADDEADAWENRVLCSDGNCIGVIGPDGRCKECRKKADP